MVDVSDPSGSGPPVSDGPGGYAPTSGIGPERDPYGDYSMETPFDCFKRPDVLEQLRNHPTTRPYSLDSGFLKQVERIRSPCVRPPDAASRNAWAQVSDRGSTLSDAASLEIGDSSQTTILYADTAREAAEWVALLRGLVQLVGESFSNLDAAGNGGAYGPVGGLPIDRPSLEQHASSMNLAQQYETGWRSGAAAQHVTSSNKLPALQHLIPRDSTRSSIDGGSGGSPGTAPTFGRADTSGFVLDEEEAPSSDLVQLRLGDGTLEPLYDIYMGTGGGLSVHLLRQASPHTLKHMFAGIPRRSNGPGVAASHARVGLAVGSTRDRGASVSRSLGSAPALRRITSGQEEKAEEKAYGEHPEEERARPPDEPPPFPSGEEPPFSPKLRMSMTDDHLNIGRPSPQGSGLMASGGTTRARGRSHRRSTSEPTSALDIVRAQLGGATAIGVVCETRLHRGGRHLLVKSSVEVFNMTDEPVLITMPFAVAPDAPAVAPVRVEPGESKALPLKFTGRGSDAACRDIQMMPAEGHSWGQLVDNGLAKLLACPAAAPKPVGTVAGTAAAAGGGRQRRRRLRHRARLGWPACARTSCRRPPATSPRGRPRA